MEQGDMLESDLQKPQDEGKNRKKHTADPYDPPLPNLSERARRGIRNNPMMNN